MASTPNELQQYIDASLQAGETKEGIKNSLLAAGWDENLVNGALEPSEASSADPDMKSRRRKKSIGILTIVVVVGVAAYFTFIFLTHQETPAPQGNGGTNTGQTQAAPTTTAPAYSGPVAATCVDSDARLGNDAIYVKGSVTTVSSNGNTQTLNDYCADSTHLIEYICYESPPGSGKYAGGRTIVKCANGCLNGACTR